MLISVVIRTLNEARYLDELLSSVRRQEIPDEWDVQVVIVDSGSVDETLSIARRYDCTVTQIDKSEFTFGRSLNRGCDFADGEMLVFVSGHCVPVGTQWLSSLVLPIANNEVDYVYGRQIGRDTTKFSESRVFEKYYPARSLVPQEGYFANNANAALRRTTFEEFRFNESLTGLEDMDLAKRLSESGRLIGYVASAEIFHIHDETWLDVRNRYEREAVALFAIAPESQFRLTNFLSSLVRSVGKDCYWAARRRTLFAESISIVLFRYNQFLGSYWGLRLAQSVARSQSKNYFYPDRIYTQKQQEPDGKEPDCTVTHESSQQSGAR
ncbi:MAG: glycosyltransferase [Pseudomonadales bacterium]|nr:glycosyltransferase [Pseudomonadales bacterium]